MLRKTKKYSRKRSTARRNPQIYSRTQSVTPERDRGGYLKISLILLFITLVYIVLYSPAFKIKNIVVEGSDNKKEKITKIVEEVSREGYFKNNILFLREESIKEKIGEDSEIKEINITSSFFKREIKVKVKESEPKVVWEERGMSYLVDNEGIIYKEIGEGDEESVSLIKIINKIVSNINEVGEAPLDNDKFNFIKNLMDNFELLTQDKLSYLEIENSTSEITLYTDSYKIYFDTGRDVINQINNLNAVKKEATSDGKTLDYVDLRIETRVFYKTR